MGYETLVSCSELDTRLGEPSWAVVDCRFSLRAPAQGRESYRELHIPGAVYAHLDEDMSGPVVSGRTGRHPLPSVQEFAETLSRWGIGDGVQVVAYDDAGGSIAARFWWMLNWVGHSNVAVLDGGWQAWRARGFPVKRGVEERVFRPFHASPRPDMVAEADDILRVRNDPNARVFDARGADRFRGENETIDPVAGHIPWARSVPFADNLDANGHFRSSEDLKKRFDAALDEAPVDRAVVYCGSGVTAAHDLLAMAHAGLKGARLYPGSWSDWITVSSRPIARG